MIDDSEYTEIISIGSRDYLAKDGSRLAIKCFGAVRRLRSGEYNALIIRNIGSDYELFDTEQLNAPDYISFGSRLPIYDIAARKKYIDKEGLGLQIQNNPEESSFNSYQMFMIELKPSE